MGVGCCYTAKSTAAFLCLHVLVSRRVQAYLLVVDTHTWGSFMRAKVSLGPPKQAAQLGAAGVVQPAASKICAAVLPSQPATGSPYRSAHTCMHEAHVSGKHSSLCP